MTGHEYYVTGVLVVPRPNRFGATVWVPNRSCLDTEVLYAVRKALKHHLVVHVTGCQSITMEGHVRFAGHFGSVWERGVDDPLFSLFQNGSMGVARRKQLRQGEPQSILKVITLPQTKATARFGVAWHTDNCNPRPLPPTLGIMVPRNMPSSGGGTRFLSMFHAFEQLPAELKDRVARRVYQADAWLPGTGRPAVPSVLRLRGQDALFSVHPNHILGTCAQDFCRQQEIDRELVGRVARFLDTLWDPRANFSVKITPSPGDVVLWDQRATQHQAALDFGGSYREIHRILVVNASRRADS